MITRLELTNFMSHKHTVIEPAAGLTVLVGPNNVGKSAVVAALQILCHNDNSTYVLRHGERECAVKVHTDDGHVIEWRRKIAASYVIDGQVFTRLGIGGFPDELHKALRLPKVDATSDSDFDVHFGTQKAPIFLLGNSPTNAAQFFASSSDAIRLVAIQKIHKEKLANAQREKKALEANSRQINAELELLEPIVDVDYRLKTAEHAYDELTQMEAWLDEAKKNEAALREQAAVVIRRAARAEKLSALSPPPQLLPLERLEGLISALELEELDRQVAASQADALVSLTSPPDLADIETLHGLVKRLAESTRELAAAANRNAALAPIAAPPELANETELTGLITLLNQTTKQSTRCEKSIASLATITPPPVPTETREIDDLVVQFDKAVTQVRSCQTLFEAAQSGLTAATVQLRQQTAGRHCPVCGSALDPDRVVARAAAGLGGHDHE